MIMVESHIARIRAAAVDHPLDQDRFCEKFVVVVVVVVDDGRENSSIPESTESSSAVTSRRFRDLARFDRSAGACPCGIG